MRIRNRHHLFLSTSISRGRLLKEDVPGAGGGAPAGGDSGAGGDNGGNSGDSGSAQAGTANNDGQQFDPGQFWKLPESGDGGNQNQNQGSDGQGGQNQEPDIGTQIAADIKGFKIATPIFDDAIAQEIADGKLDGINGRFQDMAQTVLQQSVVTVARIMKAFEQSIDSRISGMINNSQTADKDERLLGDSFQAFSQPAMQPVIRGVFQQSLTHTKGDRAKAIEMTKGMLRSMGQLGRQDFGIPTPPRNPDDIYGSDGAADLVRDLLEAK